MFINALSSCAYAVCLRSLSLRSAVRLSINQTAKRKPNYNNNYNNANNNNNNNCMTIFRA